MFIDEKTEGRRSCLLRSSIFLAFVALVACVAMMLALVDRPLAATATAASFRAAPELHTIGYLSDQRFAFAVLLAGFVLTAGGGFALSRRSFRDVLKAESRQSDRP